MSGPAGEIPPGESIVKRCWRPDLRSKCHLPCSAEKLGDLGDPGFQARLFWKRLWGFFLVTDPPQGRQHIGERWFFLLGVPGPERKAEQLMTRLVKPNHYQSVDEQRHRRGPPLPRRPWEDDWQGPPSPRTACNSQRCIQWPSDKHRPTGFPRRPIKLRTVEHLIGTFPFHVALKTMVRSRSFPAL